MAPIFLLEISSLLKSSLRLISRIAFLIVLAQRFFIETFLVFILTIYLQHRFFSSTFFADDTLLYTADKNLDILEKKINF